MDKIIDLNAGEVSDLFKHGHVEFDNKKSIILLKNDIFINDEGRIYLPVSMQMTYESRESLLDSKIEFIQRLICQHFNIEPYQVMYLCGQDEEFEFRISLSPDNIGQIVVMTKQLAFSSSELPGELKSEKPYIGRYRQLNGSYFYFAWFERSIIDF